MTAVQREIGRRQVFDAIREAGPLPRIEISDQTGISRATVTAITAELLSEGLIEEIDPASDARSSGRGRPRVDLKICGAAHLVAGVKLSQSGLSMMLLDFDGTERATAYTELDHLVLSPDALADALGQGLDCLAGKIGRRRSALSGVGLGVPGIVDALNGFVHWSPSLTETNVELASLLTKRLGLPTVIDNDANLVAAAEQRFGMGRTRSDFVVVTIESGVGLGVVLNNEIYRGARGCGAEFGHIKVQLDGALCRCGQRGCLEAYVADYALLREAALLFSPDRNQSVTLDTLLAAAHGDDPLARSILNRAGKMFAMGLANLINIFDPQLIVLAGDQLEFDHLYSDDVMRAVQNSIVQVDKPPPEIVVHNWGTRMWAMGAAASALDHVADLALSRMGRDAA